MNDLEEEAGDDTTPTTEQGESNKGEDDEDEDETEGKKEEPKILTEEITGQNLSLLCKSGDGLSHAFVRLDLKEKNLSDISIIHGYIHLRYVDISKNRVTDLDSLNNLTHLLSLKADHNSLESIGLRSFPFLQYASFSFNNINDTSGLQHPLLEQLNLNNNCIENVKGLDGNLLSKLHTLEIKGNKIQSIEELYIPSLKTLYIGYNDITNLNGITRMNKLENLHVRKNQIKELTCFSESMNDLQYLNLRENLIANTSELSKLQSLSSLKSLSFSDNPICNEDDFRMEVLMNIQSIIKFNKEEVVEEEKLEALEIYKQRQLEKEKYTENENMENL